MSGGARGAGGGARARPPVRLGAASARSSPVPVLRRAGVSPRAPGGGGEPRAARPRADAAAARSRSAPHPAPRAAERGRRARSHIAPPAPRLRPLFLWASQRDGTLQRVRCEDYDPRNRIYLTRTPAGWRAFPKTDTFDAIRRGATPPSPPPPSPPPPPVPRERDSRGRRRRFARRPRRPRRAPRAPSPAWPAPDIESQLPSHTIAIPRVPPLERPPSPRAPDSPPSTPPPSDSPSPLPPSSSSPPRTPPPEPKTAASPPAAPASPPPAPAIPPQPPEPTPLDNLLAVAELEFNQQRGSEALELEPHGSSESGTPQFAFLPPEEGGEGDMAFEEGGPLSHDDLFESIGEAHYLPELGGHDEALLESLVEKGCEDNQILGRIDRLAAQLQHTSEFGAEALLAAPVADIIERLESLESPSRSAAQGLLHLARRSARVDAFVPDDVFVPDQPEHTPPRTPHAASVYPERVPDLDTFDYAEYAELAGSLESSEARAAAPTLEESAVAAMNTIDRLQSKDDDLRELLANDMDFKLSDPDPGPVEDLKEEPVEVPTAPTPAALEVDCSSAPTTTQLPTPDNTYNRVENVPSKKTEGPRDMSMARRLSTPYASPRRIDIPRAPSRDSDAMQSPQPSGIPANSSPEVLTTPTPKSKQPSFLESLYASTSPKMYTSEVTITKHQFEPLNLGKNRKSASPTVSSCSEDIRNVRRDPGEPQEKRRRESNDLAKICSLLKKCGESKQADVKQKNSVKNLTDIEKLTPIQQLELLKSNKNFNLPDPLMIPKERLTHVMNSPGREIPALLMARPDLNLPEIIRNHHSVRDPDVLVLSLKQLADIVDPKSDKPNYTDNPKEKSTKENAKEPVSAKSTSKHTERNKSSSSERTQTARTSTPQPQPDQSGQPRAPAAAAGAGHLAEDIDAANSATAYQMLWLPAYLNHLSQLEAFAACSQNADFMKALQSGYGASANYANLSQMFHPSRFMNPAGLGMMPPMDYDRVQLAMWQEAMSASAAAAARHKQPERADAPRKEATPTAAEFQSPYAHLAKSHKTHSSRTSPSTNNYTNNQRMLAHNHFMQSMYPGMSPNLRPNVPLPNLQIPYYNPTSGQRSPRTPQQKSPTSPYFPNNNYLHAGKHPDAYQRCASGGSGGQGSPRPRISVKSLQELQQTAQANARRGAVPPGAGVGAARRRDEPEVGSTTGAAPELPMLPPHMPPHPHDPAAFPIWNPLYSNQKGYTSPWSWTTVTATGD